MPYTTKHKLSLLPPDLSMKLITPTCSLKNKKNTKIKAEVCGGMHGGLKN